MRPDPRQHRHAHLWQDWDGPSRSRSAHHREERLWWGIVGLFATFAGSAAFGMTLAWAQGRLG